MQLTNHTALITGAASGMGAATAKHLTACGMQTVLLDYNIEQAEQFAKELNTIAIQCDVSNAASAEKALQKIQEKFKAIHLLVNCAGIATAARAVGREGPLPLEDFRKVIDVNLIGTFNMIRLTAAMMSKQESLNQDNERGVIINTASVAAYEGQIGQAAYSASKGGVVSMTLPLARELAKFGIRVMTIAPGIIATPMMSGMPENVQQSLAAGVPFPARLGESAEFAQLVQHIAENPYLNGSTIRLDGALRMAPK